MKTTSANLTSTSLLPAAVLLMAACAADTADSGAGTGLRERPHEPGGPHGHVVSTPGDGLRAAGLAGGAYGQGNVHMVYRGGPVLSNVAVYTVFWSSSVADQAGYDAFYGAIVDSPYVDWLSEYDTPSQHIARGKLIGSYVDDAAPGGGQISDDQIRQELARLLDNSSLPKPDANTLFMVHFPAGVTISMQGMSSCQQFCAYHSSFSHGGASVYYGIIPDLGGSCGGCNTESTQFDSTTVIASHEVGEAITDPNIGIANTTQDESQLGWYDDQNSEIGDMCEGQSLTVAGYRVTKLWSNQANACIGPKASSGTGGTGGGSTGSGSSGSASTGSTGSASTGSGGTGGGGGGACAHALCAEGATLDASCDPCAAKICQSDRYCCASAWDNQCVAEVGSICNASCGGGKSCSHPVCSPGAALSKSCGPCTGQICAADPYCCATAWDATCVQEAGSICGKHCP